jgi:hypothetical protein
MILNKFALILKETKHAALLMALPRTTVTSYAQGHKGTEAPTLDATAVPMLQKDYVWRAKRSIDQWGGVNYWDGKDLYSAWDGTPKTFDYDD